MTCITAKSHWSYNTIKIAIKLNCMHNNYFKNDSEAIKILTLNNFLVEISYLSFLSSSI